jgi:hypothetical protein
VLSSPKLLLSWPRPFFAQLAKAGQDCFKAGQPVAFGGRDLSMLAIAFTTTHCSTTLAINDSKSKKPHFFCHLVHGKGDTGQERLHVRLRFESLGSRGHS